MSEKIEMKPVVDLMGATKKVAQNMVDFFEKARDAANKDMISGDKFWKYLTKELKTEHKIKDEDLVFAGMPVGMVLESLDVEEAEAAKPTALTYKNLTLKMKDGSSKTIALKDVLPKVTPFAKNFASPMEAIIMGDPDAILKVFQHIYGKDVEQWTIPAEEASIIGKLSALSGLALVEMYRAGKFNLTSPLFKTEGDKLAVVDEAALKQLVDGFEKADRTWLQSMFPHTVLDYLLNILNETKTVINDLSKEELNARFPHIDPSYLVNLKESQLKDLVAVLEGCMTHPEEVTKAGGKVKQGTVGRQALPVGPTVKGGIAAKKYPSKMAEAVGGAKFVSVIFGDGQASDDSMRNLKQLGLHVYTDPVSEGSSDLGYIVSTKPVSIADVMADENILSDLSDEERVEWFKEHQMVELED